MEIAIASIQLFTELTKAYIVFQEGATPEQRKQLTQFFIDDRIRWDKELEKIAKFFDGLALKDSNAEGSGKKTGETSTP
jgi:hypothetical protein